MTGHVVCRIIRPFSVFYFEVVRLQSKSPSFDAGGRLGPRVVPDELEWLVIRHHSELFAVNIEMKMFTAPYDCKRFTLCLRVAPLYITERSACICDDVFLFFALLQQYCAKSYWTSVNNELCFPVRVEVRHRGLTGETLSQRAQRCVLFRTPLPGSALPRELSQRLRDCSEVGNEA